MNLEMRKLPIINDGILRFLGSFDLQHWTRIGAMNLANGFLSRTRQEFIDEKGRFMARAMTELSAERQALVILKWP